MFCKLALKNVVRSVRDYTIYFITILFGVCIFYVFNSMESQSVMEALGGSSSPYVSIILSLIDILSVFVSVVLAFLILYANTFLIRRRKRELGTYLLLGMTQRRIAMVLFLETLFIGLLALGAGLALGLFLSQFISVFTAGIFSIHITEFHFVFSLKALLKTALYFGIIFFLVMLFNSVTVSRCKLIDLIQAEQHSEGLKFRRLKTSVVLFLVGVVLLAAAYTMLLTRGMLHIDALFWLMLVLGTLGTLLFFRSLSGFLLELCQKNKKLYYKDLNMFVLRQFNSKINTTYVSMTIICLMLLLAIGITACSVGLNNTIEHLTSNSAPYDFTLMVWSDSEDVGQTELAQMLSGAGFDPEQESDCHFWRRFHVKTQELSGTWEGNTSNMDGFNAVALSDFNALMALQGKQPLTLADGCYGVLTSADEQRGSPEIERQILTSGTVLEINGVSYAPDPNAVLTGTLGSGAADNMLILPDTMKAENRLDETQLLCGNYLGEKEEADARFVSAVESLNFTDIVPNEGSFSWYYATRLEMYQQTMGSKILVLFLGIYLGIIFLLTSAAVLALQQLSQAADNVGRYRVLSRLGASESMRSRSLYIQIFLSFFLPLALAVIHAVVGMKAANDAISIVGRVDALTSSIVTAVFILVVYGAYFLATCWGGRRMIRGA